MGRPSKVAKVDKAERTLGGLATLAALASRDLITTRIKPSVMAAWGDAEEERAAIVQYDADLPRAWAEAFARPDWSGPPAGVSQERWHRFVNDCGAFLDGEWANRAHLLGWSPKDLFGCDRGSPSTTPPTSGLLWQLNGGQLILLSGGAAIVAGPDGTNRKYVRLAIRSGVVLAWRLVRDLSGWGAPEFGDQPHG